jgi:hypothetical protein
LTAVDENILRTLAFVSAVLVAAMVILRLYVRARRRAHNLRLELENQRKDALRSVKFMLRQMDYDAEVLRLLRHARTSNEKGDEVAFNGALNELIAKERVMMKRLDSAAEFENYLKQTYSGKKSMLAGGKRKPEGDKNEKATPEQMKDDIETFIGDLEKIRGGAKKLLDEKVDFFGKWIEGPEHAELRESLSAMEKFLEAGDTKGLETIAERKKGPTEKGMKGKTKKSAK